MGNIILCVKAFKLIAKGCIYHIVRVRYVECEVPPIESVPVVRKFSEVFLDNIPRFPLEREIDFGIDLLLYIQPFSIPTYQMTPDELKELKDKLNDLLDKSFIQPRIFPWCAPILFV